MNVQTQPRIKADTALVDDLRSRLNSNIVG